MKKLCAIMIMVLAVSGSLFAEGVQYGTVINNTASITAGNIASAVLGNTSSATVRRIGGARYTIIPSDQPASPLGTAYADFTLENMGNALDRFAIAITAKQSNAFTAADTAWTYSIVDMGDAPIAQSTVLSPAGTFQYRIKVVVPVTADDGDYMEFRVAVTSLTNAAALTYQDDTGYWWGRSIAYSWAGVRNGTAGLLQHAFTNGGGVGTTQLNSWVQFLISGPVLSISKWISSVTVNGVGDVPKPGAIITWSIRITNNGTSAATNIIVRDTRQGATTYVGRTVGAYLTTLGGADPNYTWTGVHLPAKSADTVTMQVRIQ